MDDTRGNIPDISRDECKVLSIIFQGGFGRREGLEVEREPNRRTYGRRNPPVLFSLNLKDKALHPVEMRREPLGARRGDIEVCIDSYGAPLSEFIVTERCYDKESVP